MTGPENVRELENIIEQALVLGSGDRLGADDLPTTLLSPRAHHHAPFEDGTASLDYHATLEHTKRELIVRAFEQAEPQSRRGGAPARGASELFAPAPAKPQSSIARRQLTLSPYCLVASGFSRKIRASFQVPIEKLARDGEHAGPIFPLRLGPTARMFRTCIRKGPATSSRSVRLKKVCGNPSTRRSVTSLPPPFNASYNRTLCPWGTELSARPCMIRNGGAPRPTYVIGLASRTRS
jgi:hypothetical protein